MKNREMLRPFKSTIAAAAVSLISQIATATPLHVMIDPGHGGSDTGAARGSLKESEIALKVSLLLAENLKRDPRFKISMTRTKDQKLTLSRRTQIAHDAGADLFVSIHINSSTDPRAHGTEIYFQNQLPADEEALYLVSREHEGDEISETNAPAKADPISTKTDLKRILEDLHRNHRIQSSSELGKTLLETLVDKGAGQRLGSRAIRQAPFHVVSYIDIPSVLIELGFITHAQEGPRLAQESYQKELARVLADGLTRFKERVDNDKTPSQTNL